MINNIYINNLIKDIKILNYNYLCIFPPVLRREAFIMLGGEIAGVGKKFGLKEAKLIYI